VRRVYGIATYDFDEREVVINGGLRFALRENLFLSGAAGIPLLRADTNPNQYITYLGVQWTF